MMHKTTRRTFLRAGLGAAVGVAAWSRSGSGDESQAESLLGEIDRRVIFAGRESGTTWFHPRACMVPAADGAEALMTLQSIGGSDVFGPVHFTTSRDRGKTWSDPQPIPGLGRRTLDGGYEMGVCDVVPEYHAPSGVVLAIGHNVYYTNNRLARPQRERWPVYVTRSGGDWSEPRKLEWDDPRGSVIFTCGCAQRVTLDNGDVLIPLSFGPKGRSHRSATSVRCTFDGEKLTIRQTGSELSHAAGRGLLEPSLAHLDSRFYMTIRAEDGRGYVSTSDDGLRWRPKQPWTWDDGEPLAMSTTQQHWLVHSEGLFLVYTRKAESNARVFRWRAPLFVAEVDRSKMRLIRESERVVLPLVGDGVKEPEQVARMGNFHTTAASPDESWVTVGETRPAAGWSGDTLLARIAWRSPNELAPQG